MGGPGAVPGWGWRIRSVPVAWVEGWFFVDKKVQGYKPALTVYDNNTFMKVWLKE